jgi:hypothetical protein
MMFKNVILCFYFYYLLLVLILKYIADYVGVLCCLTNCVLFHIKDGSISGSVSVVYKG